MNLANATAISTPTAVVDTDPIAEEAKQIKQVSYRVQLLQKANPRLPVTAEGLPIGFYRIDLLPEQSLNDAKEEVQALRNAYTDLSFDHGYPTLSDGRPFWYKLDFEPGFAFGAFQIYLEALEAGPRELGLLAQNEEIRNLAGKIYSYSNSNPLPEERVLPSVEFVLTLLQEFAVLYLWRARAKAHDLYTEASYRHLKLRRQTTIENEHFLMAANMLRQLKEKILEQPKFFEDMAPRTAIDLLSKLVAIQRISTGLPAAGPLPNKEAPEDVSFEMIMRTLGQKAAQGNIYDQAGREVATQDALGKVLEDPRAAGMMQEVIIRITKASQNHEEQSGNRFKGRGRTEEILSNEDLTAPFDITGAPGTNLDLGSEQL